MADRTCDRVVGVESSKVVDELRPGVLGKRYMKHIPGIMCHIDTVAQCGGTLNYTSVSGGCLAPSSS